MTAIFNIFLIGTVFGAGFQAVTSLKTLNHAMAIEAKRITK
jgi:hypothetical protein